MKLDLKADIGVTEIKAQNVKLRQTGLLYAETEQLEQVTNGNKAFYIGESIKVLQSIILKADPVLNELCSLVKDFQQISKATAEQRDRDLLKKYGNNFKAYRKKLMISFT